MAIHDPPGFLEASQRLQELLDRAEKIKPGSAIEPPLPASEFSGDNGLHIPTMDKDSQYNLYELAARRLFQKYIVRCS
jgi:hypothetical protein